MAQCGDMRGNLLSGQLPALTRLGTLGYLDLQNICIDKVMCGDAKATRGHLLDARITFAVKTRGILTAFT